jgi:hypothetical protein
MPNTVLTLGIIANELLRCLAQGPLRGSRIIYTDALGERGAKLGDTVRIRKPQRFRSPPVDMVEQSISVVLEHQARAQCELGAGELTLSLDSFQDRYLARMACGLAREAVRVWPSGATLVCADLPKPKALHAERATDPDTGLAIRVIAMYNAVSDTRILRADMLFGFLLAERRRLTPLEVGAIRLLRQVEQVYVAQREALRRAA